MTGPAGVDADLDLLFDQVRALRELAAAPEGSRDDDRVYDFGIRWGTFLAGRFERLVYYAGRGELSPEQQTRYDQLCGQLRDAMPDIRRLGVAVPSMPAERG